MPLSKLKIIWFVISVLISIYIGSVAYDDPLRSMGFTDLLATILSILIGVSLAISSLLFSIPRVDTSHYNSDDERKRIEKVIKQDDTNILAGQNLIFWFYYISLLLAVTLKYLGTDPGVMGGELHIKILAALFSFIASLSLLWSATLPSLLKQLKEQRKDIDSNH